MKTKLRPFDVEEYQGVKVGSVWSHKKKGSSYQVARITKDQALLKPLGKGSRQTWKYIPLLKIDYVEVKA